MLVNNLGKDEKVETFFCARTDIGKIIESLPKEESEHMHRVGILVGTLTQKLYGLEIFLKHSGGDEYKYYGEAASYHDIGKAWVPKSILTKPGKLTKEETEIMYKHPKFAHKLFNQINAASISGMPKYIIKPAFNAAVYHHERWNGKGYPYGIGFENIPLVARITSLCDAYDAITSPRIYRNAKDHFYACCELESNAGTQFDPMLVQVFLDNEREFSALLNKMISCL